MGSALVCVLMGGCSVSPMAKHAAAFSAATATVIDSTETAYHAANDLRIKEQVGEAVEAYDQNPQWSPDKDFKPLLTPEQLGARVKVLDGLKAYADSLVAVTGMPSKTDTDALQAAATNAGQNLMGLSTTVSTSFAKTLPQLTATEANYVSTALYGLGEFLQKRKVKTELPKVTGPMNANVQSMCELLEADVDVMRRQADLDYGRLIEGEEQFILHAKLDDAEKRSSVRKMVGLRMQQKANDDLLSQLKGAVVKLALTHDALAKAAQGDNPGSLKETIAELQAAGKDLSNYYKGLAAATAATQ